MLKAVGRGLLPPAGTRLLAVQATGRLTEFKPLNGGGRKWTDASRTVTTTATAATIRSRWNSSFAPRHGKGVEPEAGWETELEEQEDLEQEQDAAEPSKTSTAETTKLETADSTTEKLDGVEEVAAVTAAAAAQKSSATKVLLPAAASGGDESQAAGRSSSSSSSSSLLSGVNEEEQARQAKKENARRSGPLDEVLHMKPPEDSSSTQQSQQGRSQGGQEGRPTMSPPPYVHQFDSYSLVKQLQEGGYTQSQAITSMKGIRALLGQHLDVALASLVSKSDVENETYLFRAACSELHQEIKNNRRLQDEQMRQQRTHLQHEVDILAQSLNQEATALNDQTRGMFNDRRMAVREEQKTQDSAVQQINYKMSTVLVSDSKSAIEGVRWILIRRAVLGILFMAVVTLSTIRYATYLMQERHKEEERRKADEEELRLNAGRADHTSAADAAVILTGS